MAIIGILVLIAIGLAHDTNRITREIHESAIGRGYKPSKIVFSGRDIEFHYEKGEKMMGEVLRSLIRELMNLLQRMYKQAGEVLKDLKRLLSSIKLEESDLTQLEKILNQIKKTDEEIERYVNDTEIRQLRSEVINDAKLLKKIHTIFQKIVNYEVREEMFYKKFETLEREFNIIAEKIERELVYEKGGTKLANEIENIRKLFNKINSDIVNKENKMLELLNIFKKYDKTIEKLGNAIEKIENGISKEVFKEEHIKSEKIAKNIEREIRKEVSIIYKETYKELKEIEQALKDLKELENVINMLYKDYEEIYNAAMASERQLQNILNSGTL